MPTPREKPRLDSDLDSKIQDARAEIAALRRMRGLSVVADGEETLEIWSDAIAAIEGQGKSLISTCYN